MNEWITPASTTTNANATASDLLKSSSGTNELLNSDKSDSSENSTIPAPPLPPTAHHLAFIRSPSGQTYLAGQTWGPALTIGLYDSSNQLIDQSGAFVTISLFQNPAGGALSGTLTQPLVNGIAQFNDLSLNTADSHYILSASTPFLPQISSAEFTLQAGPANRLILKGPSLLQKNICSNSSLILKLADAGENPVAVSGSPLQFSLAASGSSGSTTTFWQDSNCTQAQTNLVIPVGQSSLVFYAISSSDTPVTLSAAATSVAPGTYAGATLNLLVNTSNSWSSFDSGPSFKWRNDGSTLYTGSKVLHWGGTNGSAFQNTGYVFDKTTQSWSNISNVNSPSVRQGQATVFANGKMYLYGGNVVSTQNVFNDLWSYDVASDTWTEVFKYVEGNASFPGVPGTVGRTGASLVWTGSELIIWGGKLGGTNASTNSGVRLNLSTLSSTPMTQTNAPLDRYSANLSVWTGTHFLVWGGQRDFVPQYQNTGGLYHPLTNTWKPISTTGAPTARLNPSANFLDNSMVIYGGASTSMGPTLDSGAVYHIDTDTWTSFTSTGVLSDRAYAGSAVADHGIYYFGGIKIQSVVTTLNDGAKFDLNSLTFSSIQTVAAPSERSNPFVFWDGSLLWIWGGATYSSGYSRYSSGGTYTP